MCVLLSKGEELGVDGERGHRFPGGGNSMSNSPDGGITHPQN